jgi:hypothetical protein
MVRDFNAIVETLGSDRYFQFIMEDLYLLSSYHHLEPEYNPELAKKRGSTYGFSYQMKVVNSFYTERPDLPR